MALLKRCANSLIASGATIALISSPSSSNSSPDATTTPPDARADGGDPDSAGFFDVFDAPCRRSARVTNAEIDVSFPKSNDCSESHGASISTSRISFAPTVVGQTVCDAEFAIHLSARRIVDPRDDPLDLKHPLRDQRGHDVAVVAVGDGDEAVGGRRAGAFEHVVIDAGADDDVAFEFLSEAFESGRVLVDDDDFVTVGIEVFRERGADAAAPNDEVSHERPSLSSDSRAFPVPAGGPGRSPANNREFLSGRGSAW